MANNPLKCKDVIITQINSFVVDNMGGFNIIGLGDDGKIYQWNYLQGAWLTNWATPSELKALKGKDGKVTYRKKKA